MTIESIAAITAAQPSVAGVEVAGSNPSGNLFANLMQTGIADMNASLQAAEGAMSDLAAGKSVELHEVMIDMERARISVQTFVQVRNALVESYQDLMRMQL